MGNQKEFIAQIEKLKKEFDFAADMAVQINADRLKHMERIDELEMRLKKCTTWAKATTMPTDIKRNYIFRQANNIRSAQVIYLDHVKDISDYMKLPIENIEWLCEGTAAGREEDDRNEFAEWCRMQPNYGFIRGIGWRCNITKEDYSTDFMYQLFKQQKENP